jgi:long-subunit acyl-CoA synthetase (AMP-forming)
MNPSGERRPSAWPPRVDCLPAINARTLCESFQMTAASYPDLVALRTPHSGGEGMSLTWAEYAERVQRVAAGLAALGVARGDTVGLMLSNRPEFHWCDTAAMHLGAIAFSIYNTSAPSQIEDILRDAENKVLITEREFFERIADVTSRCPELAHVVLVDGAVDGTIPLELLESMGHAEFDFERGWRTIRPDDLLSLIYTSGTSGPPKGVELTHANVMYEIRALTEPFPALEPGECVLSYLPMAHLAERAFSHYHAIARATTVATVDDPAAILAVAQEVRPTWFVGVPRVWEKIKVAVEANGDERLRDAVHRARTRLRMERETRRVEPYDGARDTDAELLAEVRSRLGFDRVKTALVGGAPIAPDVIEFFAALGLPLHEVWGMTEASAVVTVNPPGDVRLGSVGRPLRGAEVRIASDGEILVRGPMTMRGYRHDAAATAEALDGDGWLHTGDLGELDDDGYLRLIGRKKELIVNAAGKNMSPANIESRIKLESPVIAHAVAIGDARPYNVALLTLDRVVLGPRDPSDEVLRAELREAVQRANAALSRVEQVKRFAVIDDEWAPGGEELTPTMKLRREKIAARYAETIKDLYTTRPGPDVVEVTRAGART